jgi:hypothetical protein
MINGFCEPKHQIPCLLALAVATFFALLLFFS